MDTVLDASALLAFFFEEPGADAAERAVARGAAISAVNVAEAFTKMMDVSPSVAAGMTLTIPSVDPTGAAPAAAPADDLIWPPALVVEPFGAADAAMCALLRPLTRRFGLSLRDRACLALGRRLGARVLTADRAWLDLDADDIGVTIEAIR